jgi:hypothetical protein
LIPEQEFLLRAVRSHIGSEGIDSASDLLATVADWPLLLRLAARHRITPLVLQALHASGRSDLTQTWTRELRAHAHKLARKNLILTAECLRLFDLFAVASIPVVPFKGPTLAERLYGDAGLREFCDLDFLIHRNDVPAAKRLLIEHGCETDLPADRVREAAYLNARHELHFVNGDGSLIEIHQSFLAPYCSLPLDDEDMWRRLERGRFCGREVLALQAEDLLLVLCAHGTKHGWSKIAWICDVAMLLVKNPDLDWPRTMTRASEVGAARILLLGVSLAHDLLGAGAPLDVLRKSQRDPWVKKLSQQVQNALFTDAESSELQSHLFFLEARERLRDKLRYCAHLAFMPTEEDHSRWALPPSLLPLYYPLHAMRVAGKYGLTAIRNRV